jgi:mRNA interferase MazF
VAGLSRGQVCPVRLGRTLGSEQSGARYGVIVQSDDLPLSTVLIAPTSTGAQPSTFRPEVTIGGRSTRVLCEQLRAVDPQRLDPPVGTLSHREIVAVDDALLAVLGL